MGMASEFEKHTGSEGAIRSKNAACDRLKSDEAGGMVGKFGPGLRIFITSNPETAKFLMTLKPEMVEKAGLSDMLFGDDPKGFIGGLLYEEGAAWHRSRKILTEEFNQARVRKSHLQTTVVFLNFSKGFVGLVRRCYGRINQIIL